MKKYFDEIYTSMMDDKEYLMFIHIFRILSPLKYFALGGFFHLIIDLWLKYLIFDYSKDMEFINTLSFIITFFIQALFIIIYVKLKNFYTKEWNYKLKRQL